MKPQVQILMEEIREALRGSGNPRKRALATKLDGLIHAMGQKRLDDQQVFAEWKPTTANIQALPLPIRQHIGECERLIKENEALREQLHIKLTGLLAAYQKRDGTDLGNLIIELKEMTT